MPIHYPYPLPYPPEINPLFDPLEALTGFELMIGLIGFAVVWGGRCLAGKVTAWRKKWL